MFAGYTRLRPGDEAGSFAGLALLRTEIIEPQVLKFGGHLIRWTGDEVLVEFESVVEAVRCAVSLVEAVSRFKQMEVPDRQVGLRVGMNLDDIIVENEDVFGDGVNIAARLEASQSRVEFMSPKSYAIGSREKSSSTSSILA